VRQHCRAVVSLTGGSAVLTRRGVANRARSPATHRHRDDGDAIVPTSAVSRLASSVTP
jgi:hypothetical protein